MALPGPQHALSKGGLLELAPRGPLAEQSAEAAVTCLRGGFLPWADLGRDGARLSKQVWAAWDFCNGDARRCQARWLVRLPRWTPGGIKTGNGIVVASLPATLRWHHCGFRGPWKKEELDDGDHVTKSQDLRVW